MNRSISALALGTVFLAGLLTLAIPAVTATSLCNGSANFSPSGVFLVPQGSTTPETTTLIWHFLGSGYIGTTFTIVVFSNSNPDWTVVLTTTSVTVTSGNTDSSGNGNAPVSFTVTSPNKLSSDTVIITATDGGCSATVQGTLTDSFTTAPQFGMGAAIVAAVGLVGIAIVRRNKFGFPSAKNQ